MGPRHTLRLAALALGAGLALTACGGSGGDAGPSPATADGPVKLMVIAPTGTAGSNYPDVLGATKAAVRGVNSRGGIDGHQVELLYCNEKNDAATAKECAQKAVDEHVLAVVNEVSGSGGIMPILEKAQIPSIGSAGISADGSELSSKISFMTSPLTLYPTVCPSLLRKVGATRLGLVGYDLSVSDRLITMADVGAKAIKAPLVVKPRVPLTTSDFTPTVAQLNRAGVNGTVLVVFDQAAYAVIKGGPAGATYCHALGTLSTDWLADQGAAADSVVVATAYPELSQTKEFPEMGRLVSELDAEYAAGTAEAAPGQRISSTNTVGSWLSVQIAEKVGDAVSGDLTSATLLAELNRTSHLDLGLLPRLNFTEPAPIPGVQRLFNTTMRGARWNAATKSYVPLGPETYDALKILTQRPG